MKYHSTQVNKQEIKVKITRPICIAILVLLPVVKSWSQDFPKPMIPYRLVNDFTGLLTEQQQISLNNKLLQFNNEKSTQIYVVTYDELQGYDIADYGARLGEEWGIGQQGKDNGLLILISPEARKVTIQTGYGLEGAVPDAIARRLINNVITPGFRQERYYESLDSVTNVLMSLTSGEFTADEYLSNKEGTAEIVFGLLILLVFFLFFISGSRNKRIYSPRHDIPWWLLLGSGMSRNSDWGSFSSGRGSFGGGGGFGGFGGGGGGSFGGGGASGGW